MSLLSHLPGVNVTETLTIRNSFLGFKQFPSVPLPIVELLVSRSRSNRKILAVDTLKTLFYTGKQEITIIVDD